MGYSLLIRALQFVSVSSVILSVVLIYHFYPFVNHQSDRVSEILSEPSIVEKFRQKQANMKVIRERVSPLVNEAIAFAQYLDPPKPPEPRQNIHLATNTKKKIKPVKLAETTAKFNLIATSYYRARPEKSLALVSQPGMENRWIRPGERLGHFIIERIEQGIILYKDGEQLGQMAIGAKTTGGHRETPVMKLASGRIEGGDVEPQKPPSLPGKPRKVRQRRPMQRLGPLRPESPLLVHDHLSTNS